MSVNNSFLRVLFETEVLGRLSRKVVWLALQVSNRISGRLHHAFRRLPYVHKYNLILRKQRIELLTKYYRHLSEVLQEFPEQPQISVLIPVYKVKTDYFRECLQSVANQIYDNWEMCIVDDCSNDAAIDQVVKDFQQRYPGRVKYSKNEKNSHISITSNNCLALASGEYVALLDHDDRLYPNSLAEVVRYINVKQKPDILYSDERTVDESGEMRHDAFRKPDFSPFMHLCMNYTTHLSVYRTELLRQIGGFRKGFEGSQDHDLMLRAVEGSRKPVVHIPFCLYQWRAHPESTAASISSKPYAAIAGEKAVSEALERRGRPAQVVYEPDTHHYRLSFKILEGNPLVSIIIPNKDSLKLLEACLRSVYEKSTYRNFEILIVDNGSVDPSVLVYYKELKEKHSNINVILEKHYFNFGKMVNRGVREAKGTYVVLLNNDTEVVDANWIEEMLGLAQFPEIGAVGSKLLYPDRTIQHAGILLTGRRIAEHKGIQLPEKHTLYCNIMNTIHECSAVSAACLMIRKEKYEAVGGFDEVCMPNGYGDVDFCLKLSRMNLTSVFTPYARFFHFESPSRGSALEYFEKYMMLSRYGAELSNDPYLNPNLGQGNSYEIDFGYEQLDLNAREFSYFLRLDRSKWGVWPPVYTPTHKELGIDDGS